MIQHYSTEIVPLDGAAAQAVGALLGRTGTSMSPMLVVCAQFADHAIATSDPLDLRRLDSKLRVIAV